MRVILDQCREQEQKGSRKKKTYATYTAASVAVMNISFCAPSSVVNEGSWLTFLFSDKEKATD